MKCPCCKYEYVEELCGYVKEDYTIKSGKRKGQITQREVYKIVVEPVGDEEFNEVRVVAISNGSWNHGESYNLYLTICPKCGVTFKDIS